MKFFFLTCLALAAPLAKRSLSDILSAVIEEFYYTNSDYTYEFIKLAINQLGAGFLDNLELPEDTTLTVAFPPDVSLLSLLSLPNNEIQKFITYHVFYNQTFSATNSSAYQSTQGSFVKVAINESENTAIAWSAFEKPSLILDSAYLIDGLVKILFLNDSLLVPASINDTAVHYKWTNLTNFIKIAAGQKKYVENVTETASNVTVTPPTKVEIAGFGTLVVPFGNTYLIPSEEALQKYNQQNCSGYERRTLDFHTLANQTFFANSFTNVTVNVTNSISASVINGSVWFKGPFNSAKVILGDVLVDGGVAHVIDSVLEFKAKKSGCLST